MTQTIMAPRTDWLALMPAAPLAPGEFLAKNYAFKHQYSPGDVVGIEVVRALAATVLQAWHDRDLLADQGRLLRRLEVALDYLRQSNGCGRLLVQRALEVADEERCAGGTCERLLR